MYPLSRSFYYKSHELWERFKDVCKAEGRSASIVLGEFIDRYLVGYVDPTIPSITTYFEPDPNSIAAVQRRITKLALERAQKKGGDITFTEIRELYADYIPTPDMRNAVVRRTAKTLKEQGIRCWE